MKLIILDSSQIECRILAWFFGEEWLLQAFRDKKDPYCLFGETVYGRTITKADTEERYVCKTAILGLGFQMGAPKFQVSVLAKSLDLGMEPVRLDDSVCSRIVYAYRNKNSKTAAGWKFMNNTVIAGMATGSPGTYKCISWDKDRVILPSGLNLFYPEVDCSISETVHRPKGKWFKKSIEPDVNEPYVSDASYLTIEGRTHIYGGLITENVVQALARAAVATQMVAISKKYRIVGMEHDAIAYLAEEKDAKKALEFGLKVMHTSPIWAPDLPIAAEGDISDNYAKT